ncbi:MAG TPA: preprotein translocase subunit SecE [Alphaproteobacteria bacterium]|nr:preprotein translocase subunit SecE [Alphaproteobacteria bacterium]
MPNFADVAKFAREVKAEALRITWPSGRETRQMTVMVFILVSIVALFLVAVDLGIGAALNWLLGLNV